MLEAVVLVIVAGILVCVFIADRASLSEILKEGIPTEQIGMLSHPNKKIRSDEVKTDLEGTGETGKAYPGPEETDS